MAESTLSTTLAGIRSAVVGDVYGGNADYSTLALEESAHVDRLIARGLRQFYQPPAVDGRVHFWSFLNVAATITLTAPYSTGTISATAGVVTLTGGTFPAASASYILRTSAGIDYPISTRDSGTQVTLNDTTVSITAGSTYSVHQDDYDMPDDFEGFTSELLTYETASTQVYSVQIVTENAIRLARQEFTGNLGTGRPYWVAIRDTAYVSTTGTRVQALFYPSPTEAARLTYRYRPRLDALASATHYPAGASDHTGTIISSCMAVAEADTDGKRGIRYEEFIDNLRASIARDSRRMNGRIGRLGCEDDRYDLPRHSARGVVTGDFI